LFRQTTGILWLVLFLVEAGQKVKHGNGSEYYYVTFKETNQIGNKRKAITKKKQSPLSNWQKLTATCNSAQAICKVQQNFSFFNITACEIIGRHTTARGKQVFQFALQNSQQLPSGLKPINPGFSS